MSKHDLKGVVTALVTPFLKGRVDFKSLKTLVQHQLDNGVEGFVISGTTGESPTLHAEEVEKIFKFVKKISDNSVPLILGTGSNSTEETIKKTKQAKKLKADAALVVVPYYNKPPQRGLVAHFKAVAKNVNVPIILYNVPGRTVITMAPETIIELSKVKNIVGVKEASGRVEVVEQLMKSVNNKFVLSSGDDATCLDFMFAGGEGVISVISHVIPKELRRLADKARNKDLSARKEYESYNKLNQLMGIEANPIPVKMALHLMGIIASPELRLPLVTLSETNTASLKAELNKLGVI